MIIKLTKQQEALLPVYRDKWLSIGLSTEPANRPEAERAICAMYANAGLAAPRIVWCQSPLGNALTRAAVWNLVGDSVGASVGASVRASVWDSVGDSVWASVWDSVGDSVWNSVRASVWDSVGDSVGDSVWDSVGASVGASVRDSVGTSVGDSVWDSVGASVGASVRDSVGTSVGASVRDSVRDSVGASVWNSVGASVYGSHDANWLGFYDYFREVCGLVGQTDKLTGLWLLAKSSGWALPQKKICWVSERHNVCELRDGVIHCESGPAIAYPDGFAVYAIGGVRVTEQIVMRPETQTIAEIDGEKNEEIKRIRIERFGWPRYIAETDAQCVDVRTNDVDGTLESLIRLKDGSQRLLCACRSTGRVYAIGVPREVANCEQSQTFMAQGSTLLSGRKRVNLIGAS